MMTWFTRSLQARLLSMVLGSLLGVWLAAVVLTWVDTRHELDELLDGHLVQSAALLVAQYSSELEEDHEDGHPGDEGGSSGRHGHRSDDHRALKDAPVLHRYAPRVAFQVFHEGQLLLRSAQAPELPMVPLQPRLKEGFHTVQLTMASAVDRQAGRRHRDDAALPLIREPSEGEWRVFVSRGQAHDLLVMVAEEQASRSDILHALLRGSLGPLLLALPFIALLTWWSVRRAVAPLRELDHQLAQRRPQDLSPVQLPGAPSELEPALEALNGLLERIEALMAAERRFTADAAHELRTPIAAIRTQAQVALGEGDPDARRHALLATLQGCDRASHLVQQLLTLSRLEGGASPAMADLDLRGVARTVLAELAPQALRRGQSIELEADAACPVRGNEVLLAVLLRNLVDNASRYSPDGARLRVRLQPQAGAVRLRVEDSGPGLADADCERLGERFFRVLGSEQPGSGLGWSIVRRIAAVHAAVVQVGRSTDLGGLSVELRWPAAEAPRPMDGAAAAARPSGH